MRGPSLDLLATQRGCPRQSCGQRYGVGPGRVGVLPGIKLDYTRPGKPTDNELIESFNGRLRDEFLNVQEFVTLHDAREKLRAWQED